MACCYEGLHGRHCTGRRRGHSDGMAGVLPWLENGQAVKSAACAAGVKECMRASHSVFVRGSARRARCFMPREVPARDMSAPRVNGSQAYPMRVAYTHL